MTEAWKAVELLGEIPQHIPAEYRERIKTAKKLAEIMFKIEAIDEMARKCSQYMEKTIRILSKRKLSKNDEELLETNIKQYILCLNNELKLWKYTETPVNELLEEKITIEPYKCILIKEIEQEYYNTPFSQQLVENLLRKTSNIPESIYCRSYLETALLILKKLRYNELPPHERAELREKANINTLIHSFFGCMKEKLGCREEIEEETYPDIYRHIMEGRTRHEEA